MSTEDQASTDSAPTDHSPTNEPLHEHLVDSFAYGWRKLNLVYENEPRGEMPESPMPGHMIVVAQGDFRGSMQVEGTWQHVDYAKGDIAILPVSELFPRTFIDREVPLIELFLDPKTLDLQHCIELEPQWNIRDPLIEQMGLALQQEAITAGAAGVEYADSMAVALSTHLVRRYGKQKHKTPAGQLSQLQKQQLDDYIQSHLGENLAIDRLAQIACLSPGHFTVLFKRSFNLTPHQYVVQCRIRHAQTLLHKSDLTIVEIAHAVGFRTQSHFTRIFRQQIGVTPKQYQMR